MSKQLWLVIFSGWLDKRRLGCILNVILFGGVWHLSAYKNVLAVPLSARGLVCTAVWADWQLKGIARITYRAHRGKMTIVLLFRSITYLYVKYHLSITAVKVHYFGPNPFQTHFSGQPLTKNFFKICSLHI